MRVIGTCVNGLEACAFAMYSCGAHDPAVATRILYQHKSTSVGHNVANKNSATLHNTLKHSCCTQNRAIIDYNEKRSPQILNLPLCAKYKFGS